MQLSKLHDKSLFITCSLLAIGSLVGSFGYPLQQLEVYKQNEPGTFNTVITRTYILTENDRNYPWGFQKDNAKIYAQIHQDYKLQKILLLAISVSCSLAALSIGKELVPQSEHDTEIARLRSEGRKELKLKEIKQYFALANKSQQLLFLDEMKALMEEFGSPEQEILEVDEINALYEQVQPEQSPVKEDSSFRKYFPEDLDTTFWKAVSKAKSGGVKNLEIIRDVLNCNDQTAGQEYLKFLEEKYKNDR